MSSTQASPRTTLKSPPGAFPAAGPKAGPAATRTEQLAERFAEHIRQGLLAPGARLPSVRDCAARHGLSPTTVVGAYDLLQARGLVLARPQRGFFVRDTREGGGSVAAPAQVALPSPASAPAPTAPVDATALIRGMLTLRGLQGAPGMGTLPEAWLDAALLQRALRRSGGRAGSAGTWLAYGDPAGDASLRTALALRLGDLGIAAAPAQIVTTVGATHGLDIVARTLLAPGDAVLVDEPGWAVEYARLTMMGARLLPVPRGRAPDGGPDLEVMERLIATHRPRLYVTVSVLHNPTGVSVGAAAAHRVLRLAEVHDLVVVEDDTYAWLAPPHATRLAQLDALQRTVYVSGFAKILAPQWRIGFLAAAPALAERFIDTKLLSSLTSPGPLEQAMAWCLGQGAFRRHVERVGTQLAAARARTVRLAREAGCRFAAEPAGLFGWVDVGADTDVLAQALLDAGWFTAPGSLFHVDRRPTTLMRVNFAAGADARFWSTLRRLRGLRSPPQRGAGHA
jgi:DNA-binding transcriptional MocR family regulator